MESLQAQNPLSQQVPIQRFQMTESQNNPVPFRIRPLVERVGSDNAKNLVRATPSLGETLQQLMPNFDFLLRDEHLCLQSCLHILCDSVFVSGLSWHA